MSMTRHLFFTIQLVVVTAFLTHQISSADSASSSQPLNVLLICVDDLKPTIGSYGDPVAVTPNIDALAARGVQFNSAYCNQAVCAPSRNALMTSLRPQTIGVYDLGTYFRKAAPDAITLGQHLIENGYQSHSLGKIYHRGHGNVIDLATFSEKPWVPKVATYATKHSRNNMRVDHRGKKRGPATERGEVDDARYADGQIAKEAIKRLEAFKNHPDEPFFMGVGFIRPHLPFVSPAKYWDLYDPAALPMPRVTTAPQDAPPYAGTNSGELFSYSDYQGTKTVDSEQTRQLIHGYYAATSYVDAQIGKVISAVERLELMDNTIIVLWGDHGWHLGDHGMWCKHTNYEQANRIPLVVLHPGAVRGLKTQAMVETVDVYPTLCELLGLPTPAGLDGRSFANVTMGQSTQARQYVTHVYPRGNRLGHAVRDQRYRLVRWVDGARKDTKVDLELYDYQTDPLETRNLAGDRPDEVQRLTKLLDEQPKPKRDVRRQQKHSGKKTPKKPRNKKPSLN